MECLSMQEPPILIKRTYYSAQIQGWEEHFFLELPWAVMWQVVHWLSLHEGSAESNSLWFISIFFVWNWELFMYGATPWYQNCICTGITSGWSVTTVEAGENSQPMHLCLQGGSVQIMFETWEGWFLFAYTYCSIHWCEILYVPNLSTNKLIRLRTHLFKVVEVLYFCWLPSGLKTSQFD